MDAVLAGLDGKGTIGNADAVLAGQSLAGGSNGIGAAGYSQVIFGYDPMTSRRRDGQGTVAVEGEVKSFFESVGANQGTDVDEQTIGGINNIIMGIVNNTSSCCQMFSGVDAKGNVECYVGIKVSKQKIANAVADNLSKSHKEDIRNRAEEFRKQLSEDLKQYREE